MHIDKVDPRLYPHLTNTHNHKLLRAQRSGQRETSDPAS